MTKLYTLIRNIDTPHFANIDRVTGEVRSKKQILPARFSITWPDGRPCIYAEMYLDHIGNTLTVRPEDGGSLKSIAGHLSHLIRFSFESKREFWEFTHNDIESFKCRLLSEANSATGLPKRNNDTVKKIISRSVDFFRWLQNHFPIGKDIVGVPSKTCHPQIRLKKISIRTQNGKIMEVECYDDNLPAAIPDTQNPVSTASINDFWDAAAMLTSQQRISNKLKGRLPSSDHKAHIDYMRLRRELVLMLLESTGCRPGELARIPVKSNVAHLKNGKIAIPTLKRRDTENPLRVIPLDFSVSMKIQIFVSKHRTALIERLQKAELLTDQPSDILLLASETGQPLTAQSLEKEFSRLRQVAGIADKSCMRMFRHRFITNMVKIHLMDFSKTHPGMTRELMVEKDYRTILKRVAAFTNHKNIDSLLHYVDLAWDELGVFEGADYVQKLETQLRGLQFSIQSIKDELPLMNHYSKNKIIELIAERLSLLIPS